MKDHSWQLENGQLYFQLGDTVNEVTLVPAFFEEKLIAGCLRQPFLFRRDPSKSYYFSDSLQLVIEDDCRGYSAVGDICYFPDWQLLGITLREEEFTLGISRYKIGKIKGNLHLIQSLSAIEEGILFWQGQLKLKK